MVARGRDQHGNLASHQILRELRQPIGAALGPAVLNGNVLALDEAGFAQTLAESGHEMRKRTGRGAAEETDHPQRGLLCSRGEGQRDCGAEQC